jgi:phage N-6-adenine-methyltransferase
MDIAVWPEFKNRLRPLSKYERERLEENLIADGCREPLVVWARIPVDGEHKCYGSGDCRLVPGDGVWTCTSCDHNPALMEGVLLDGHNRLEICNRLGIHYEIVEANGIQSEADALRWIDGNQAGRRNEPAFVRGDAVLEHKAEIQERARANQQGGQGGVLLPPNSAEAIETREVLADMAGMGRDTLRKVERLREEAEPELLDALRREKVSIHLASQVVDLPDEERTRAIEAMSTVDQPAQVLREAVRTYRAIGSGENEWYTPAEYAEMARFVMGSIDLDPASCDEANEVIKADAYYTKDDDGLSKDWHGNVWCNPPYSRDLMPAFVEKLKDSYASGQVQQAILVSHNNTDTAWFHSLASVASAICFPKKRIRFYRGDDIAAPTNGQAFFYLGTQTEAFKDAFCGVGFVVAPI